MEKNPIEVMNTEAFPPPSSKRRKRACAPSNEVRVVSRFEINEERQYQVALQSPEVKAAFFEHECALARRNSISRKLCAGSSAVDVKDLARSEESLSAAKDVLLQLASQLHILERHPVIAAILVRAN